MKDVQERAGAVDVQHQARSSARARAEHLLRYGAEDNTGRSSRGGTTAVSASFDFGVPRKSACRSTRGHQPAHATTPVPVRVREVSVFAAFSHGDWSRAISRATPYCTPVFSTSSITIAAAATRRWARVALGGQPIFHGGRHPHRGIRYESLLTSHATRAPSAVAAAADGDRRVLKDRRAVRSAP